MCGWVLSHLTLTQVITLLEWWVSCSQGRPSGSANPARTWGLPGVATRGPRDHNRMMHQSIVHSVALMNRIDTLGRTLQIHSISFEIFTHYIIKDFTLRFVSVYSSLWHFLKGYVSTQLIYYGYKIKHPLKYSHFQTNVTL